LEGLFQTGGDTTEWEGERSEDAGQLLSVWNSILGGERKDPIRISRQREKFLDEKLGAKERSPFSAESKRRTEAKVVKMKSGVLQRQKEDTGTDTPESRR